MSAEAWEHFKAFARAHRAEKAQPTLTAGDLLVGNAVALKALAKYGHTYRGGYARIATEFGVEEWTVRYHAERLRVVGAVSLGARSGRAICISFPGLDVDNPDREGSRSQAKRGNRPDNRRDSPRHREGSRSDREPAVQRAHPKPGTGRTTSAVKSPKRLEMGGARAAPPTAASLAAGGRSAAVPLAGSQTTSPSRITPAVDQQNGHVVVSEHCPKCGKARPRDADSLADHMARHHPETLGPMPALSSTNGHAALPPPEEIVDLPF